MVMMAMKKLGFFVYSGFRNSYSRDGDFDASSVPHG